MIKIANRQIFIFFFDFLKKNMGPSNMGNPVYKIKCTFGLLYILAKSKIICESLSLGNFDYNECQFI